MYLPSYNSGNLEVLRLLLYVIISITTIICFSDVHLPFM